MHLRGDPRNIAPPQTGAKVAMLIALTGFAIVLALYAVLFNQPAMDNTTVIEKQAPNTARSDQTRQRTRWLSLQLALMLVCRVVNNLTLSFAPVGSVELCDNLGKLPVAVGERGVIATR